MLFSSQHVFLCSNYNLILFIANIREGERSVDNFWNLTTGPMNKCVCRSF